MDKKNKWMTGWVIDGRIVESGDSILRAEKRLLAPCCYSV